MKRSLQLPLAIALALGATNALALGLGPVHVKSKLNQPLEAEIPVIQGTAGEAEGLLASLAGAEDFERVGLSRARLTLPLDFSVTKNAQGETVIRITSQEPVRDAFLDLLVEANWPKGRLLREYAILLDPPVSAPAASRAPVASSGPVSPGTVTLVRRQPRPDAAAAPAAKPAPAAVPVAAAAPERKASGGEYKVEAGDTLSAIASAESAGAGVTRNQMMLALFKHNSGAFYRNNINALKRGAILRIPSAAEAKDVGDAKDAAAQVQAQVEDWRGGRASPTLVADAGDKPEAIASAPAAKPGKASSNAAKASERLELVPPKAGKDSLAMADRPGSNGGGSAALNDLKSELARTKEALTARDQESGELKSRVRELEDIQNKNDRLISLKDSEIAELQQKLKQMQDGAAKGGTGTAATHAPAAATPAKDDAKGPPRKEEIWGNAEVAATAKPAAADAKPADAAKPAAATGEAPKPSAEPAKTENDPAKADPAKTPVSTAVPLTEAPATAASVVAGTPDANSTPAADKPATTASAPQAPAATPAPAPQKPAAKPKPRPVPVAAPWYEEPWVLPAAGGGALVIGLLAFLGLRKRKPAAKPERNSIADAFGSSPLSGAAAAGIADDPAFDTGEAGLREQIAKDPSNLGLRLELLSIHYAERATDKFEAAAAEMRDHVGDPSVLEWQEAIAMGQEIAPHNPMFSTSPAAHDAPFAAAPATTHESFDPFDSIDSFDEPAAHHAVAPPQHDEMREPSAVVASASHGNDDFGFNLDEMFDSSSPAKADAKPEEGFGFDDLPPLEFGAPVHVHAPVPEPIPEPEPVAVAVDDDFLLGDDAVGTKLDLAKAYMDMGDPDGARSMLDEVVAEGNDAQKAEARRLLAEVR